MDHPPEIYENNFHPQIVADKQNKVNIVNSPSTAIEKQDDLW